VSPPFSFAYQPIVDGHSGEVFAHEALVRGSRGESAGSVLRAVPPGDLYLFDRDARVRAIQLAAHLGLDTRLSLNLLPQGLDELPDAIGAMLAAAAACGVSVHRLILEVTEGEIIRDACGFAERVNEYRALGVQVAIDDFGAGYSGLNLLADFQPDLIKLDMALVRGIDGHGPRQAIVRAVLQACDDLGIDVIAEGIETGEEFRWFMRRGVRLYQGYLFARPAFEALPIPVLPATRVPAVSVSAAVQPSSSPWLLPAPADGHSPAQAMRSGPWRARPRR
jgi:EAL domain-containing protein (putative c-di-GMP-specific phosphodiesterase class I)